MIPSVILHRAACTVLLIVCLCGMQGMHISSQGEHTYTARQGTGTACKDTPVRQQTHPRPSNLPVALGLVCLHRQQSAAAGMRQLLALCCCLHFYQPPGQHWLAHGSFERDDKLEASHGQLRLRVCVAVTSGCCDMLLKSNGLWMSSRAGQDQPHCVLTPPWPGLMPMLTSTSGLSRLACTAVHVRAHLRSRNPRLSMTVRASTGKPPTLNGRAVIRGAETSATFAVECEFVQALR